MQIVIRQGDREREVVVDHAPDAVVGDLLRAAGISDDVAGVDVDGRYVDATEDLGSAPIPDGAVVEPAAPHGPVVQRRPAAQAWLTVVAGVDAGTRHPLGAGTVVIGRSPDCHVRLDSPTVSERHAVLHVGAGPAVTVEDAGSRNGTWVDGELAATPVALQPGDTMRLGALVLRVDGPDPHDVPTGIDRQLAPGTIPFNRPPRPASPASPPVLPAPEAPDDQRSAQPLRVAAMLAPIALGGAMIWMTGNPRFALFALLSPVMLVGNWFSSRHQATRANRSAAARSTADLERFTTDLARLREDERRRREQVVTDLGEILRRAHAPTVRLWERRLGHDDALRLRLGSADVAWDPPVELPRHGAAEEVTAALGAAATLPQAPVEVDLGPGDVVGIVGDRAAGLALARSLVVQATVLHGPADLHVGVATEPSGANAWRWAAWLPHTRDASGRSRLLSADAATSQAMLAALRESGRAADERGSGGHRPGPLGIGASVPAPTGPVTLLVVDDLELLTGRRAPARELLAGTGGPTAGIVLAPTVDRLPSSCSVVVEVASDLGDARVLWHTADRRVDDLLVAGLAPDRSRDAARALAHLDDPEQATVGAGLPTTVRLLPLLGMSEATPDAVRHAWQAALPAPAPSTPIGVGEDGPLHLDLHADGPHALVGGTTGSGKSELLRSWVAGLAARVDPDHLVFVLVDYKGGSAFDACAQLPHVVGLVTDLDDHLGERALVSLDAELAHRERRLREAGTPDLPAYLQAGAPLGPMPRMVVVIDEFATLATELPDFLDALVGIAQRGRSLGVHLVLATQRPRGMVNANVRANTNLRIALRVQDAGDSSDVIDRPDAAELDRTAPGRAYVRRGHGDVALVQTALSTARAQRRAATVAVTDLVFAPLSTARTTSGDDGEDDAPTDLDQLVAACRDAHTRTGMAPPRRPWLPMLPDRLALTEVLADAPDDGVPFAMADDPAGQKRRPVAWRPADGHLAIFGMVGSGTTTALQAVGLALGLTRSPDRCHCYGLDVGGGGLAPLAALPHCGAVVPAADREGQFRLLRTLRREVERRRDLAPQDRGEEPLVVVLLDGVAAFLGEHEGPDSQELTDDFRRVFQDGPQVGVVFALTGDRPAALPLRLGALVDQRVLLRHADPADLGALGRRPGSLPSFVPGRGLDTSSGLVVQVGLPDVDADVADAVKRHDPPVRPPTRIATLPARVDVDDLDRVPSAGPPVRLPVGLADHDLAPALLELHPGEHLLVAGPARSGRSTLLQTLSSQLRTALPDAIQVALCDPLRSPLHGWASLDAAGSVAGLASALRAAVDHDQPWVVFVDDAPAVEDHDGLLAALLSARPDLHVVVAGRPGDLRAGYGHWSRPVRQSRTGVLLQPDLASDGDVLSVRLPRRVTTRMVTGRGFLVQAGEPALVQFAQPPADPPRGTIGDRA